MQIARERFLMEKNAFTNQSHEKYWNPRANNAEFVNGKKFLYSFNLKQEKAWTDWHSHEDFGELTFAIEGVIIIRTKEKVFYVQKNQALWIPAGVEHCGYCPVKVENRSLFIHNSRIIKKEKLRNIHTVDVQPLLREIVAYVAKAEFDLAKQEHKRLGYALIDQIVEATSQIENIPIPQNYKLVELCTECLLEPEKTLVVSEWSKQLGVSEKTLSRTFLKETGLNLKTWHIIMRMHHAKKALEGGEVITNIALDCGYSSLSSFIATFKKVYGQTPSQMQKNKQGENI